MFSHLATNVIRFYGQRFVPACACACECMHVCARMFGKLTSKHQRGRRSVRVSKKMQVLSHAHMLTLRVHSSGLCPHTQTTADRQLPPANQLLDGSSRALKSLRECAFSKARFSLEAKRNGGDDKVLDDPIPLWAAAGLRSRLARVLPSNESVCLYL